MDAEGLKAFAQTAGIGGLALLVVRQVLGEIVRKASKHGSSHAEGLLTKALVLTGMVGLAGIVAWVWVASLSTPLPPTASANHGSIAVVGNVSAPISVGMTPTAGAVNQ